MPSRQRRRCSERQSAEERACKEEKRRRAEAKVAAKETRALEETVARQEAQLAAAREAEAQAAREREAKEERQRAKAEAQRCRVGEKARRRQCPQQPQAGHTKPCHTSTPHHEHARAVASPPPNAILGDALALALNQHVERNPRGASERARAESEGALEELEETMVRRAIALTSPLRVNAPDFVPAASKPRRP